MYELWNLIELYRRYLQAGCPNEEQLDEYLRQAAELADLRRESGEEPTMGRGVSDTTLAFYAILSGMDHEQRQPVEFCPCGHVLWYSVLEIILQGGFKQLLTIEEGHRLSAPTFPTSRGEEFVCGQCEADFEYNEARLAAALDGWE